MTLKPLLVAALAVGASSAVLAVRPQPARDARKLWVVAHRGASAYAPENTVPAFKLAADQGATFFEFDLQLTKDKQLVCLHDTTLERTTDVEEVFPDRARTVGTGADAKKQWPLEDFTLAEIRKLDAGAWFGPSFKGTRIPTFAETIDAARGRIGLFIEIKSPEKYPGIEAAIVDELKKKGLDRPGADARTPVLLQSFSMPSLEAVKKTGTTLPVHFLFGVRDAASWVTPEGLQKIKAVATGLSPEKGVIEQHAAAMKQAKSMGMLITPYTFRASAVTGYPDVRAEMAHYVELGVDGVITDNPDQAPGAPTKR